MILARYHTKNAYFCGLRPLKRYFKLLMFNIPPVTKNIIIINLLMFFGKLVAIRYGIDFDDLLGLHFFKASDFRLYQFFTYMFVHAGWEHIFFNMFAVWMFGRVMEQVMGSQKFLFYYIVCGLGAGLMQEGAQWIEFAYQGLASYDTVNVGGMVMPMSAYLNNWTTVGASGAVYGILLSFGMTFPNERLFIIPIPVPIKAKWFVMGYAVIELLSALGHRGDNIAHMAHLGGMLFGLLLILYWRNKGDGNGRFFGGGLGNIGGGYGNNYGGGYYTRYEDVTNRNSSARTSLATRMKNWWHGIKNRWNGQKRTHMNVSTSSSKHAADMEWRQKDLQRQEEIDNILAKVKQGGYNSLTDEEKRKLFEASER